MIFKQYKWADGSRHKADPQKVGTEIERLGASFGGAVTAPVVVTAARDKSSALHGLFEWNNRTAADAYRLEQARSVLRSVVVVAYDEASEREMVTRAFVSYAPDTKVDGARELYAHVRVAMESPSIRGQIVAKAWAELTAWKARYQSVRELADVFEAIDRTAEKVGA